MSDIDQAIDWAIENLNVDTTEIYVVGASGGGYAALCHFMKSKRRVKEYSVWVPITDLKRYYFESKARGLKYANDIIKCTCGKCQEADLNEAVNRSPLFWKTPVEKLEYTTLNLHTGIHDGYTGAVPIAHSVLFYNKIITDLNVGKPFVVPSDDLIWMITTQTGVNQIKQKIGNRQILYFKSFKNISLTIFEGTHEVLVDSVL